ARALGYLDWANQPDPFRRYAGARLIPLPILRPDEEPLSPPYEHLYRTGTIASSPITIRTLSRFFEYALALSAWKQAGDVRWALRSNPSSGNLHPTEGYLLIEGLPGIASTPGLYHYAPKEHGLERRVDCSQDTYNRLMKDFPPRAFLVGLTSVHWREAWKYGERAFRYCQHDAGHAIGTVRIAAATLGWNMMLLDGLADDTIAQLLGLDRADDFEGAEPEHPDCVAVVWPGDCRGSTELAEVPSAGRLSPLCGRGQAPAEAPGTDTLPLGVCPRPNRDRHAANGEPVPSGGSQSPVPLFLDQSSVAELATQPWYGKANRLSPDDPVCWEIIDAVAAASWKPSTDHRLIEIGGNGSAFPRDALRVTRDGLKPTAGQVIRQRRSALAFDGKTSISAGSFYTMLGRVMPGVERDVSGRTMPWDAIPWAPTIHLALFVHRVDGLSPGLYMLVRDPAILSTLRQATHGHFAWRSPPGCPDALPLFLLQEGDIRQLAAQVSCHQDIAGDSAFSLGMIAELEGALHRHGPWFYRRLFWETGLIGQVLYLEAEAAGVRATGIGCFFDDPVHQVLGFNGTAFQSLYHFTTGGHVEDPRLTTLPPYDQEAMGNRQ
ncbi:MAG: SagB/ThcOx family dehydrogenase, partial [Nitrospiraceae bacterium]